MGITEQFAEFIVSTPYESVPGEAVALAGVGILDCVGCMLQGATEPQGRERRVRQRDLRPRH